MRESTVEKNIVAYAKSLGWWQSKFGAPGDRGNPDRIFLRNSECFFIEFKAPGKKPTKLQLKRHGELQAQGFQVIVVDNIEFGRFILDAIED